MKFYKIWPDVPDPISGRDELAGDIPARALQFCEPFLAANRMGSLLCPPVDFSLIWDGREIFVQFDDFDSWIKLDRIFIPGFANFWLSKAPAAAVPVMPPFLEAFPERGVIQAWSGFFSETDDQVSTWIRAPVNRFHSKAYDIIEGIIETDWWFGPLFTNIQMSKTDHPVRFTKDQPWLQVFEIPRALHLKPRGDAVGRVASLDDFTSEMWRQLTDNANRRHSEKPGSYKRISRRGERG